MSLAPQLALGFATAHHAWSWALLLTMAAKIGSTLALLALKAGRRWHWVQRHEPLLWWTTKLSALAVCACAAMLCRLGGDAAGEWFFAVMLLIATLLVAARIKNRRAG